MKYGMWLDEWFRNYIQPSSKIKTCERYSEIIEKHLKVKLGEYELDELTPLVLQRYVTGLIHSIYGAAYEEKDFRTMQFLDWFVKEQGEEETNANNLVTRFDLFGNDPKSLYMLDNELKARVYSAPSLVL